MGDIPQIPRIEFDDQAADCPLTRRERQILKLLTEGLDQSQIAARLYRSRRTVEHHTENIRQKIGARTLPQAVSIAWARGWLRLSKGTLCWLLVVGLAAQMDSSMLARRRQPQRQASRTPIFRVLEAG